MAFVKVGFHGGTGPGMTGIGDYLQLLDQAKIPFCIKSVNDVGLAVEAAKYAQRSGVPHNIILRFTNPDGAANDLPDFSNTPEAEAQVHWDKVRVEIDAAPEMDPYKDIIWIEPTNEIDTHTQADWLGWFSYYLAMIAANDGYRVCLSGMNAGQPEPEHWELPGFRKFLELCAANPETVGVSLHEGKVDDKLTMNDPIAEFYPHLIGRFIWLYDACLKMGIGRPTTFLSEWSWAYDDMPSEQVSLAEIKQLSALVAQYEALRGVFLWNLVGESKQLTDKLQKMIGPVTSLALSTTYPDPVPPPDGNPPHGEPRVQYARTYWVYSPEATNSEREQIALMAADKEITAGPSYDDAGIGALDDKTAVLWNIEKSRQQEFAAWYATHYPGTKVQFRYLEEPIPPDPLEDLELGAPFRVPFAMTSPFDAPRDYGNGLHEGTDYDILGADTDSKEPVLALYDGTVIASGRSTGAYAERVIISSSYNGENFTLWYAHMDARYVQKGDRVVQGQPIGELGGSGGFLEHVHINLQHQGTGLDGYVVEKVRDPEPFISMTPVEKPGYTGPPVEFVAGVDQPASDWYWNTANEVFEVTGLFPKFHTPGNSHSWYVPYKHPVFNAVRVVISPSFANPNPDAIYSEIVGDILKWWQVGMRDFILFNEPNIPSENLGKLWDNGSQFGATFVLLCDWAERDFPGIRIWFPGMSPGPGDTPEEKPQHQFISDAADQGALARSYGIVCHSYSGITNNVSEAAGQIVDEVKVFQDMWAMDKPLVVGEFSVNRPASAEYKAAVYKGIYGSLAQIPGVQAAYSFTSSWYGGQSAGDWGKPVEEGGWDENREGWLELKIHEAYAAL